MGVSGKLLRRHIMVISCMSALSTSVFPSSNASSRTVRPLSLEAYPPLPSTCMVRSVPVHSFSIFRRSISSILLYRSLDDCRPVMGFASMSMPVGMAITPLFRSDMSLERRSFMSFCGVPGG